MKKSQSVSGRSRLSCVVDNSVLGAVIQILTDQRVFGIQVDPVPDAPTAHTQKQSAATGQSVPKLVARSKIVRRRPHRPAAETRMGRDIIRIMGEHKGPPLTSVQIGAHLAEHGYSAKSASPSLSRLLREGVVVRNSSNDRRPTYSLAV